MKNLPFLAAALLAAVPATAHANSIDFTSFAPTPATADISLSSNILAFAYYGDGSATDFQAGNSNNQDPINNSPTTDVDGAVPNLGNFTNFITPNGGYPDRNPGGPTAISYTDGLGPNPSTASGLTAYDQIQSSFNGASFSITSTLFQSTETFQFYLTNYSTTSDLIFSLNDAAGTTASLTNKVLSGTDPTGATSTVMTITVTGDVGDVLTFTDRVNDSDPGTGAYGGIAGLEAVTVVAPEPSTYAMFFAGLGLLVLVGRFRGKIVA